MVIEPEPPRDVLNRYGIEDFTDCVDGWLLLPGIGRGLGGGVPGDDVECLK